MLLDTNNKLLFYLQSHREELLSEWSKAILVNQDDPFKEVYESFVECYQKMRS